MNGTVRTIFGIALAVVLLALGVYGLQNSEPMPVYVLFWTFHGTQAWIPAGVFTLLVFFICILYGLLSGTVWQFRHRRLVRTSTEHQSRASTLGKELEDAKAELARLRQAVAQPPTAEALSHPDEGPKT